MGYSCFNEPQGGYTMITKIELTETIHTMGDTTEEEAAEFCEFLETKLAQKYPSAEVTVHLDNHQSSTSLYVEDADNYDAKCEVNEFINACWEIWS
jgi:hypothetical protein